jgi:hypothetical protein
MLLVIKVGATWPTVTNNQLMVGILILILPSLVQWMDHRGKVIEKTATASMVIRIIVAKKTIRCCNIILI